MPNLKSQCPPDNNCDGEIDDPPCCVSPYSLEAIEAMAARLGDSLVFAGASGTRSLTRNQRKARRRQLRQKRMSK